MSNLDFFAEYENQKSKAKQIFESLDKKINSDKIELNEAFFGLIKTEKEKSDIREDKLKDYFDKLMQAPNWKSYKINIGDEEIEIGRATQDEKNKARDKRESG